MCLLVAESVKTLRGKQIRPNKKNYLFLGHISPQIDEGMRVFFFNWFFFFFSRDGHTKQKKNSVRHCRKCCKYETHIVSHTVQF